MCGKSTGCNVKNGRKGTKVELGNCCINQVRDTATPTNIGAMGVETNKWIGNIRGKIDGAW